MVSVCLACFNGEKFIVRQIDSILAQLGPYDELVISDDNSTDNTSSLLLEISDRRVKVVSNELFKGPVGNFQNAINNAEGDFILLSDQDDVWLPDKVKVMSSSLLKCDLVISDCIVVDQNLNPIIPSFFAYRGSRPGFIRNLYKNSYIGCCMGFRREVLSYVLPFPKHIHMHDWWIGMLVQVRATVKFLPEPLMMYVRHGDNASPTGELSTNSFFEQLKNRLTILFYMAGRLFFFCTILQKLFHDISYHSNL